MAAHTLESIGRELLSHEELVLAAHVSPDADAVGSVFGLAATLASLGKRVSVYLADPIGESLYPLLPKVPFGSNVPSGPFEALVVLDTAAMKRVGPEIETLLSRAQVSFNIDHHVSNPGWAKHNFIDEHAPATAVLIYEMLDLLRIKILPEVADLLYAGLLDDTGGFCFSNTNSRGFRCAAALVDSGARPEVVSNTLYFSQPLRLLKLQAAAIDALELMLDGKLSYITVTQEMLDRCGAQASDTEGLIDIARRVQGTEAAAFQRQLPNGAWKVSLRSKGGPLDVNSVASAFGGGGHRAAAGCTVSGSSEEVKRSIVDAVRRALCDAT